MSRYTDQLRKLAGPAGPLEGRDPVRASRTYVALRSRVLAATPAELGIVPSESLPRVWAVIADLPQDEVRVTVVAVADGTTSLYLSTGGWIIGAGSRPAVAAAGQGLLEAAEGALDALSVATNVALPPTGSLSFMVVAYDGIRRVELPDDEAAAADDMMRDLCRATREVVTQLQLAESQGR
jgi:hypothetical protein